MKKILGIACVLGLMACQSETKQNQVQDSTAVVASDSTLNEVLKFEDAKIAQIYTDYINLKDALVKSNATEAQEAAKVLIGTLNAQPGCENTAVLATQISNTTDLAEQRKIFTALSNDVIAMFKNATILSGIVYVQHCPMANKDTGGDWLASEEKIQNPYFGDEMMECGGVIEELIAK
ncbi:MAG: DUF3347 domain-containing protein [Pedobacter sp.]|nr:MAG: DUF3347 domain-containing protein [Pedobacter sp.]